MKAKRFLMLGALLALALALSGCLNISQEMWVNPDGSGKMKIDMGLGEIFFQFGGDAEASPFEDLKATFKEAPGIKNMTVREYNDSNAQMRHLVIEFDVDNIYDYFTTQAAAAGGTLGSDMKLEQLANGNFRITQKLANPSQDEAPLDDASKDMMRDYFKNMYWQVIIHVPTVVNTNGNRSGNTVEWKVPMADLFLEGKLVDVDLEYNLTPSAGEFPWLIIVIVVAVLAVIALVVLLLSGRKKPEAQPPAGYPPYGGNPPPPPQP